MYQVHDKIMFLKMQQMILHWNVKRFDLNGTDFDTSNYTFTAPVTGKYQINIVLRYDNGDMDNSYYSLYLVTSNATYRPCMYTQLSWDQDPDYFNMNGALVVDMDTDADRWCKSKIRYSKFRSRPRFRITRIYFEWILSSVRRNYGRINNNCKGASDTDQTVLKNDLS